MRTNIEIDDELMREAMALSGAATKKAAVEEGLRLLVKSRAQEGIRELFGKVEFYEGYDYKTMRGDDKWDGSSVIWTEQAARPRSEGGKGKRGVGKKAA